MPVLARTLEAEGLSTVLVTNMPFWAERVGTPRILAVEFPFGHTLGQPFDVEGQTRIIRQALKVLETAKQPGSISHASEKWPIPTDVAIRSWQPPHPSPIIDHLKPQLRQILRNIRQRNQEKSQ